MLTTGKHIALLGLSLISFLVHAQTTPPEVDLMVGPEIITATTEYVDEIIGSDSSGFYSYSVTDRTLTIFKYNFELKQIDRWQSRLWINGIDVEIEAFVKLGSSFILFTSQLDKQNKATKLWAQRLSTKELKLQAPVQVHQSSYQGYKRYQSTKFQYVQSEDTSLIMFMANLPVHKSENFKFGVLVLNENLNTIWSKNTIFMPHPSQAFNPYYVELTNWGEMRLLGKVFDLQASRKIKMNYSFEYYRISGQTDELYRQELDLREYHISDMTFKSVENGNLNFVGFYSASGEGQNGVFNIIADASDFSIINESYTEFPVDFIVQYATEQEKRKAARRKAKGKDVVFYSLNLHQIISNPDATITLIAEQQRYYQSCNTSQNGPTTCVNHYIFGDIITVKFNAYGQVEWMDLLPKYQHTTNDFGYYSSYALSQSIDGTLNLIFNDHTKNAYFNKTNKLHTWTRSQRSTNVELYQIDIEGETNKSTLYYADKYDVMCRPKISAQFKANEQIIISHARKVTRFVKVGFE